MPVRSFVSMFRGMQGRDWASGALVVSLVFSCTPRGTEVRAERAPAVLAVTASKSRLPPLRLMGAVASESQYRLGFRDGERLDRVCVKRGQTVSKGQLVAVASADTATLEFRSAQLVEHQAARDLEQFKGLVDAGAVAAITREEAHVSADLARTRTRLSRVRLAETRLLSPIEGVVSDVLGHSGEVTAHGVPVLIIDEAKRVVRFGITESMLSYAKRGLSVDLLDGGRLIAQATIANVAPDQETGRGVYLVDAEPTSRALLSYAVGATVTVCVQRDDAPTVAIPREALVRRFDQDAVFVIADLGGRRVAVIRPVVVVGANGESILLNGGVQAGERIVAEGAYFLEDRQVVRVVAESGRD